MRPVARVGGLPFAVAVALLAAALPEATAGTRVTGMLSKPGYTVIALAANGRASSARAVRGRFTLRPSAKRMTLHLRAPNGIYAGPIVIRGAANHAILGVKAGARLGVIRLHAGYARPARRLSSRWVDATFTARARNGVPIGAGFFGRVPSRPPRRARVPGDRDRDGIPNSLDIDDDGDLILDNFDRSGAARASQVGGEFRIHSYMSTSLDQTVNANAAALTTAQVDAAVSSKGALKLTYFLGDSEELDCGQPQSRTDPSVGGLVYCSGGGTGTVQQPGLQLSDFPAFPSCCDADGDGFGTLQPLPNVPNTMVLHHGATTAQIGTGDVLIEHVTTGGAETQYPASVQTIFATVPALVSYNDGQGHAATVSYPIRDLPTLKSGFPVSAGPNGDVIVTMTFWRPQRRPIPPEAGEWIDIGHLEYGVQSADDGCPQRALSENDPNLKKGTSGNFGPNAGGFTDGAADQPANPANTFTYTLNLTQCLAAGGLSFNPGDTAKVALAGGASSGDGVSQQALFHRLQ